jgi:hypothetical protein
LERFGPCSHCAASLCGTSREPMRAIAYRVQIGPSHVGRDAMRRMAHGAASKAHRTQGARMGNGGLHLRIRISAPIAISDRILRDVSGVDAHSGHPPRQVARSKAASSTLAAPAGKLANCPLPTAIPVILCPVDPAPFPCHALCRRAACSVQSGITVKSSASPSLLHGQNAGQSTSLYRAPPLSTQPPLSTNPRSAAIVATSRSVEESCI